MARLTIFFSRIKCECTVCTQILKNGDLRTRRIFAHPVGIPNVTALLRIFALMIFKTKPAINMKKLRFERPPLITMT